MKEAIFYTFSTIPQVLAGTIALIGVFAIFKIRALKEELDGLAQNFYDTVNDYYVGVKKPPENIDYILKPAFEKVINPFHKAELSRNYKLISSEMDTFAEHHESSDKRIGNLMPLLEAIKIEFKTSLHNMNKLREDTINVIIFSAVLIFIIVIFIPIGVIDAWWVGIPLLCFAFIALGINLYRIVKVIKASF